MQKQKCNILQLKYENKTLPVPEGDRRGASLGVDKFINKKYNCYSHK